jgi:hypothetical protein
MSLGGKMNKPDFSIRFSEQKFHEGCEHKYIVYLEDQNEGNMSLTNGIEWAIKESVQMLKTKVSEADLCSGKTFWFYKDSEGEYAQVLMVGARPQFIYLPPERASRILELMV